MEDERKSSRMRGWNVAHTREGGGGRGVQGWAGGWGVRWRWRGEIQGFCAADWPLELELFRSGPGQRHGSCTLFYLEEDFSTEYQR